MKNMELGYTIGIGAVYFLLFASIIISLIAAAHYRRKKRNNDNDIQLTFDDCGELTKRRCAVHQEKNKGFSTNKSLKMLKKSGVRPECDCIINAIIGGKNED